MCKIISKYQQPSTAILYFKLSNSSLQLLRFKLVLLGFVLLQIIYYRIFVISWLFAYLENKRKRSWQKPFLHSDFTLCPSASFKNYLGANLAICGMTNKCVNIYFSKVSWTIKSLSAVSVSCINFRTMREKGTFPTWPISKMLLTAKLFPP